MFDAKYKNMDKDNEDKIQSSDKHQLISYLYTLNAAKAGFIYPSRITSKVTPIGKTLQKDCSVGLYPLQIPQEADTFDDFKKQMKESEEKFRNAFLMKV